MLNAHPTKKLKKNGRINSAHKNNNGRLLIEYSLLVASRSDRGIVQRFLRSKKSRRVTELLVNTMA